MDGYSLMCFASAFFLFWFALRKSKNDSRRKIVIKTLLDKERKTVKKEAFIPYVGEEIAVKDLFGDVTVGKLDSVDDQTLILSAGSGKKARKTVVATEYVSSFEVKG